jgi:hypothetical protein
LESEGFCKRILVSCGAKSFRLKGRDGLLWVRSKELPGKEKEDGRSRPLLQN